MHRSTKSTICVAALIFAAAGFVAHRATVSSRQAPVTLPAKAAVIRPISVHGERPPALSRGPGIPASDPEAHGWLDLARDHESRGDVKQAEQSYRSLLEENWSNPETHAGLGRVLTGLGDLQEAEAHLQRAVLLDPQDARTRLDLAAVQIWLLRYSSARQQLQAVVDADPEGAQADGARTLLQLVDALDAPG